VGGCFRHTASIGDRTDFTDDYLRNVIAFLTGESARFARDCGEPLPERSRTGIARAWLDATPMIALRAELAEREQSNSLKAAPELDGAS
jgi:hypothetical protein